MIVAALVFLLGDLFVFANGQLLPFPSLACIAVLVLTVSTWQRSWIGVWFVAAALLTWHSTEARLDERFNVARDGEIIQVEGEIAGLVQRDRFRQRFEFAPTDESRTTHDLPSLIRVSDYYPAADKRQGERWRLLLKIRSPRGFANSGSFDLERYYFHRRIGATAYVRDSAMNDRLQEAGGLASLRDRLHAKLSAGLDENPYRGWIISLALGERGELQDADWELLRTTGTTHLFAISGLHLGLIALFVGSLLSLPARLLPVALRRPFIGVFVIIACATYAWLAGGALPVQRALIMVTIGTLYVLHARQLQALQAVSVALLLVLMIDPLAVLSEGFWFSFAAVLMIAYLVAGSIAARGVFNSFVHIQLGLSVLMAPLVMMAYGSFPLANIPANFVAIPLVGMLLLPLVMLLLLVNGFDLPHEMPEWLVTQGFHAMLEYLARLSAFLPNVIVGEIPVWILLLLLLGVLAWWLPLALRMRRWSLFLVLPFASFFLPASWSGNAAPEVPYGEWQATFLDIGQGLSVVVRTESRALIYDTGPVFGETAAADMVLIPFLEAKRWQPDRLIVSHGDRDHAGGVAAVLKRYPVLSGNFACTRGERWDWDGVQFEILHPRAGQRPGQLEDAVNNDSCVLQVSNGCHRLLLTGDIERQAEQELLRGGLSTQHVVLVPHHGSRTSSTAAFVDAVSPELAIVAAGHANQWGFPKADVVERWQDAGAELRVTGAQGMIVVNSSPSGVRAEAMRETQPRIWRQAAE